MFALSDSRQGTLPSSLSNSHTTLCSAPQIFSSQNLLVFFSIYEMSNNTCYIIQFFLVFFPDFSMDKWYFYTLQSQFSLVTCILDHFKHFINKQKNRCKKSIWIFNIKVKILLYEQNEGV